MSAGELSIDTVRISLFGVSEHVAEAAASGLKTELARRIAALPLRDAARNTLDLADVSVGPISVGRNADAADLRSAIADALMGAIVEAFAGDAEPAAKRDSEAT